MKKFMLIAASAAIVLATGCAKNERLTSPNDEPHAIGFSNYTPKSITKADGDYFVNGGNLVDDTHFAVYGWQTAYNAPLTAIPGTPNFMNPVVVLWDEDTDDGASNTYSPLRYWPSGNNPDKLSFVAYYPYDADPEVTGISAPSFNGENAAGAVGTYAFTAKTASAASMVDFCVSNVVNDQVYGSTNVSPTYKGTVKFTFNHTLTKVRFLFKKASGLDPCTVIELVDADLSGIMNSGTLKATYTPAGATTALAWSGQAGTAGYDVTLNNVDPDQTPILLGEDANSTHNNDYFLMVPQNMAADTQKITISWRVRVYDTEENADTNAGTALGGLLSETTNTKTISLYNGLVTTEGGETPLLTPIDWHINDFITYTITIGPKPIWFTAEVTDWTTITPGGYITVQ